KGGNVVSIEGEETGEWVLVDLGDMVVHIMQPAIRDYYRLEEIWGEKEVKFGAAKRTAKKTAAAEDGEAKPVRKRSTHIAASQTTLDDDEPKKPARKTAARKTAATKTAATKTASKTAAAKTAAAKTTARKTAAKTPAGKTVKVAATKSAAPRKTAAKRTTAK
ncbi:RsfS/YbeB/iojap family protein, partial [Noviherbaspirillum sp.]|uniref:RsfS/YbeB/iojap family protein n=1 Tax=Noviherbaspirillum sp. TaxID=1926288 RepID=UPI002D4404BB